MVKVSNSYAILSHALEEISSASDEIERENRLYLLDRVGVEIRKCEIGVEMCETFPHLDQTAVKKSLETAKIDLLKCRAWLRGEVDNTDFSELDITVLLIHCFDALKDLPGEIKRRMNRLDKRNRGSKGGRASRQPTLAWQTQALVLAREIWRRGATPNQRQMVDAIFDEWESHFGQSCPRGYDTISNYVSKLVADDALTAREK